MRLEIFAGSATLSSFQFTHPGKGATSSSARRRTDQSSFNSRTLGRVRHSPHFIFGKEGTVSIHAPWEGCDILQLSSVAARHSFNSRTLGRVRLDQGGGFLACVSFNSRTLGRVRLGELRYLLCRRWFQFTHPGKGATRLEIPLACSSHVSIHAPWEGCDKIFLVNIFYDSGFNSRTLGRVRRCCR